MIKVRDASFAYENELVLQNMNVEINKNKMTGIIGPNGCGKTTFIKILTGILSLSKGTVYLENKEIKSYTKKQLAKKISVLSQHITDGFQFTVYEIVCLGRYAHQQGLFSTWSDEDENIVQATMKQTGIDNLSDRTLDTLSGGEKQRVFLAQCLTQQPDIIILDEPTNHLDIKYQIEICELLKKLVRTENITVICIFHDLNLASLFCDEIILMEKGQILIKDETKKILTNKNVKEIYHSSLEVGIHPKLPKQQIYICPQPNNNDHWKIKIYSKEKLIMSNLELKCMSTVEGITWRQNFIFDEFDEIREIDSKNSLIKYIIAKSNLNHTIMILLNGTVRDVDYVQLLAYISQKTKFDDIIIGATLLNNNLLEIDEIKNFIEHNLEQINEKN